MTNFEYIKKFLLTKEFLADLLLSSTEDCLYCDYSKKDCNPGEDCMNGVLAWLDNTAEIRSNFNFDKEIDPEYYFDIKRD